MRSCQLLLVYFVVAGTYTLCEGLKKGDPGVCETVIRKRYTKTARVRCSRGYCNRRFTETRREPILTCCSNWEFDGDTNVCQPICVPGCVNGFCESPGVCSCNPPLLLHNSTTCRLPICDPPCFNGECINDSCSCNSEFIPINETHCGPICNTGYHIDVITLECKPTCDNPCLNGTCSAPNTCTCNEGFKMNDNATQCVFKCEPDCLNGVCVSPNICECLPGYTSDIERVCKPVCYSCENGECVAPETCVCSEGYLKVDEKCTPYCSGGCVNGFCAKPDTCACSPGYKFDDYKHCIPTCEPDCVNGVCSSPNECSCHEGYIKINESSCTPRCDNCEYGECIEPNICQCNEGYELNNGSCLPVCNETCQNGYCSQPDVCVCDDGYKTTADSQHVCEPACDAPCVNSTCVSPNICKCLPGYKPANTSYKCEPECESCVNGSCIAPEVCSCNDGYSLDNGSCVAKCEIPCVNGYCHLPNKCNCDEGYVADEENFHVCYRICNDGRHCTEDDCCERGLVECTTCDGSCVDGICTCANSHNPCYISSSDLQVTNTSLAAIELTWILAAAVGFLLIIGVIAVMYRIYRKRSYETKTPQADMYGSVGYTAPDMLITRRSSVIEPDTKDDSLTQMTSVPLLQEAVEVQPKEVPIV